MRPPYPRSVCPACAHPSTSCACMGTPCAAPPRLAAGLEAASHGAAAQQQQGEAGRAGLEAELEAAREALQEAKGEVGAG